MSLTSQWTKFPRIDYKKLERLTREFLREAVDESEFDRMYFHYALFAEIWRVSKTIPLVPTGDTCPLMPTTPFESTIDPDTGEPTEQLSDSAIRDCMDAMYERYKEWASRPVAWAAAVRNNLIQIIDIAMTPYR